MMHTLPDDLIPQLFRSEYTRITAVLCRHFGLQHISVAEDIASETFLKAAENWREQGIPEKPAAWLYTVAKNKTKDYLKRQHLFDTKIRSGIAAEEISAATDFDFSQQTIADSQLAMIFAVCNPSNSREAQICLALQILCGFSVAAIASAFLSKTETIKKRLLRARAQLREDNFEIRQPGTDAIQSRLDTVLRTLYLLFNEGYASRTGNQLIRKELCSEAIRLTLLLTEHPLTNTPQTNALLALMCYQSSRLDAREDDAGNAILFEEQDKSRWSRELIEKGHYYFVQACSGDEASPYHLEAGIAYWHTIPDDPHKWEHILRLYNQLVIAAYSPMTALNRTFAYAKVYGPEAGIREASALQLHTLNYYHSLLGYLYASIDTNKAIMHYQQAIALTGSASEKHTLMKAMARLVNKR
ncbi:RNA polymerase sigma factor [Chitinophaga vietnamensis]|nr:DUF6596 domain-containing protein [Chitinophaga vietnamensis]